MHIECRQHYLLHLPETKLQTLPERKWQGGEFTQKHELGILLLPYIATGILCTEYGDFITSGLVLTKYQF